MITNTFLIENLMTFSKQDAYEAEKQLIASAIQTEIDSHTASLAFMKESEETQEILKITENTRDALIMLLAQINTLQFQE